MGTLHQLSHHSNRTKHEISEWQLEQSYDLIYRTLDREIQSLDLLAVFKHIQYIGQFFSKRVNFQFVQLFNFTIPKFLF